ncbi:MAG: HDOD domain-containing protein [Opitutae bacterium]
MSSNVQLTRFATPDDLVQQLKTLPPSPKVLLKLQQMIDCESSSVADLVAVIRVERALAARIVRIANSPIYSLGSPCESIEESVQRLGFSEVHRLALIVAGCESLSHPLPTYAINAQELWHETIACAVAAEHLARLTGEDERLAYTTGLMHSVGMIVVNSWVQSIAPGTVLAYETATEEWTQAERDFLGYDQADAGAALLRFWNFPAAVVEAVRCQYACQCATSHPRLAAILAAARWLRTLVAAPAGVLIPPPEKLLLLTLNLSEQQLRDCTPEVDSLIQDARQILGV